MTTREVNKLIAEFMGSCQLIKGQTSMSLVEQAMYHTSWDWLMPVVEKICNIYASATPQIWHGELNAKIDKVILIPICSPIDIVYGAVVQFIQWYNSSK